MVKLRNNKSGFSAVEVILIVVIVGLICVVGWMTYRNHHNATTTSTAATAGTTKTPSAPLKTPPTPVDPYAGWKTATLQYEKLSFKYPPDWKLDNQSTASPKGQGCVYPGVDNADLTSPSNDTVVFQTGIYCIGDAGAVVYGAIPARIIGRNSYMVFENSPVEGEPDPTHPEFVCLAKTSTPSDGFYSASKNIFSTAGTPENSMCYYPYRFPDPTVNSHPVESIKSIEDSQGFNAAKLIFESMKY